MEIGRLKAVITADDRAYRDTMRRVDQTGAQTAGRLQSRFKNLKLNIPDISKSMGGLTSIAGGNLLSGAIEAAIGGIGGAMKSALASGIEYNKMLENASVRFTRFFSSASEVKTFRDQITKFAKDSPIFELPEALTGAQRLLQMKFAAKEIPGMLAAIGDAVGGVGGNVETIDKVTLAFSQMVSSGKIQAEEMEQLVEANIPAWELLAKAIGKSEAETRKLVSAGRLQGRGAVQGMVAMMGENFAGQSERAGKTLSGLESQFKSSLEERLGEATAGGFEELKVGYQKATVGLATTGAAAFATEIDKLLTEQARKMQSVLDRVASGEYFKQGAEATQFAGDAINATEKAAGGIGKLFPKDHLINQKTTPKDFNVFRPEGMKDPLDRAVFGGIRDVLQWLGVVGGEEGKKAGQQIGAGLTAGTKSELEMKSPSKVFERIGLNVMQGFWDGLDAGKKAQSKSLIDVEEMKRRLVEDLRKLREDPKIRAMLDTIASAEGAGYNTLFGGGRFSDMSAHPNTPITKKLGGKDLTSTAAGRYQFLNRTWEGIAKQTGLPDFSAESQDLGAILLMRQRGMLGPLASGDVAGALTAGNREWASLPGSPYGQPTKKAEDLIAQYNVSLEKLTAAVAPAVPAMQSFSQSVQSLASTAAQALPAIKEWATALPSAIRGAIPGGGIPTMAPAFALPSALPASNAAKIFEAGLQGIAVKLKELPAPMMAAGAAIEALGSKAGSFSWAIAAAEDKFGTAQERLQNFKDRLGQNFDEMIGALIEGGDRWKDVAKNIAVDFFNELASEMMMAATGKKSIGAYLGDIVGGFFAGFFGGKKAGGGPVYGDRAYLVGEQGPELYVPGADGRIIPAGQTAAMMGGGGRVVNVTINVPIQAPAGTISPATRQQAAAEMARSLQFALGRNG